MSKNNNNSNKQTTKPTFKKKQNEKENKKSVIVISVIAGIVVLALIVLGIFAITMNGNNNDSSATTETTSTTAAVAETTVAEEASYIDTADISGKHHAEIDIKDYGKISVELDADSAPISVQNFMNLAENGFYNGLTFHRIIKDFMMQGGDPLGTGSGGSDQNIKGEFTSNGVDNPLSNTRGAIAMARSTDYNSASSQFFIVQKDSTNLDGQYAVFGYVTDGMDIVDEICNNVVNTDNNGAVESDKRPIINTIKIID